MTTIARPVARALASLVLALAGGVVLAGCGGLTGHAAAQKAACTTAVPGSSSATTVTAAQSAPVVAVLVATSTATATPKLRRERADAFAKVLDGAADQKARLLIDTIAPNGIAGATLAYDHVLVGTGVNQSLRDADLGCRKQRATKRFALLNTEATGSRVDVLGALRNLDQHLRTAHHDRVDVILLGSMLSTVAPFDLRGGALNRPEATIRSLIRRGLMPSCRGWHVQIAGGSETSRGAVDASRDAALQRLYAELFAACGGRLVAYETQLSAYPATGTMPVPPTPTAPPTHTVPPANPRPQHQPPAPPKQVVITVPLPADVLFAFDSAKLAAGATVSLDAVARRAPHGARIEVYGYSDATGSAAGNLALSRRRAVSVARYLGKRLPGKRIVSIGRGEADPVASNATVAGRARNRRVVIVIYST